MEEKYFLNELSSSVGPIGGHRTNVALYRKGNLTPENYESEDGIIHMLLHIFDKIKIEHNFVLDLGAYSSMASNVVPIAMKYGLTGSQTLLFDGENKWKDSNVITSWIDSKNIDSLLKKYNCKKEIDLLSIDLDNMDYWILESVLNSGYVANVISLEFNPVFNYNEAYSKKYFSMARKMDSETMGTSNYGASLRAFTELLSKYDYRLVQTVSNNAIFIKARFDYLNMFENKINNIKKLHANPWIEPHKIKNNKSVFGTSKIIEIKKIIQNKFIDVSKL